MLNLNITQDMQLNGMSYEDLLHLHKIYKYELKMKIKERI